MDYSTYFSTAPQALPFFGLPPTPTYADDGKLDASVDPVDAAFFPPYDTFRFSQLAQQAPTSFPPHNEHSPILPPAGASPIAPDASPPAMSTGVGSSGGLENAMNLDNVGSNAQNDSSEMSLGRTRSSSEEKDALTPAQSRRKAQNRAAQRAFRERKERHVRDLEAKLSALESSATSLATDNERLKLALQRATTENEILRATTSSTHRMSIDSSQDDGEGAGVIRQLGVGSMGIGAIGPVHSGTEVGSGGAVTATQSLLARNGGVNSGARDRSAVASGELAAGLKAGDGSLTSDSTTTQTARPNSVPTHVGLNASRLPLSGRTSAFLPAPATWDLIQAHPLVKQGVVDIADVCEALRGTARCDGQGPVFREESVWKAVEGARRGGGDELI